MNDHYTKSMGAEKRIRGYVIKRLPIGGYLRALNIISTLPGELIDTCFPGMSMSEVGKLMQTSPMTALAQAVSGLLHGAPDYLLDTLEILFDIERERIENDPGIGLDGLMEMLEAWSALNGIENFTKAASRMAKAVLGMRRESKEKPSSN